MKVLFLTLLDFRSIEEHNIYSDLLREFVKNGHDVYIVSPVEKRKKIETHIIKNEDVTILKIKVGNVQKTNLVEKGISTIILESLFLRGVKKYFGTIKFDLVVYSTPPITLYKTVRYVKKRDNASTYLLLKDIFPQNAVDMKMMSKEGLKGIIYQYFRRKEKKLYSISDFIGCMSKANVDYILRNNPEINKNKVEVCPNSIEPLEDTGEINKINIRNKYGIPLNKKVFIYGGNIGKPQGVSFLIECLESNIGNREVYFLIIGSGTEYSKVEQFVNEKKPLNIKLFNQVPNKDYDLLARTCDVGLIFLDNHFTIPNFPSRLLGYMQAHLPVLAATDVNTDLGKCIEEGCFGYWSESGDIVKFNKNLMKCCEDRALEDMSKSSYDFLLKNYTVKNSYIKIMEHFDYIRKDA